ncbi:hypothetical protein [Panacagrimonas sp.]|uniref:hypothetical protein n=1 Tax=Panacagrimonas sp. TaxID=2480088 RepID=UPI003B522A49
MRIRNVLLLAVLSLGLGMTACQKKEESPMEKAVDAVGDATNTRDNEELKDAGEDAADAVENAGEAVEEAVE